MFGKEEIIREVLPQYNVDYRENLSDDLSVRWTDRFTIDGTWAGNLFQFYIKVMNLLARDIKIPFQMDQDLLRKGETVVHEAIREAFVNSLIHADYRGVGGIVIQKFKDSFKFMNPGSLLISRDQLLEGNVSECRNKALQTMFTMIGAAEKAGSGIDKIFRGWQSQHWRLPSVKETAQPDRIIWTLPMTSLIPQDSLERLKQLFGPRFYELSELEVQTLVTADIEKGVDNARMRQITNTHPSDMTQLFQVLVNKGFLIQKGQKRGAQYILRGDHLVHKDDHLVHKDDHLVHKDELSVIAAPAIKNKRLKPKEIEKIILRLCSNRFLSKKEIGILLQRNPVGLKSRFLTQMVENGLLKLKYPDKPNRTDQAYTSANFSITDKTFHQT